MYKLFFSLILSFIVIITLFTCVSQPKMHKTVFVYNSEYQIAKTNNDVETKQSIPVQTVKQQQVKTIKHAEQKVVAKKQTTPTTKTVTTPKITNKVVTKQQTTKPMSTVKTIQKPVQTTAKPVTTIKKQVSQNNVQKPVTTVKKQEAPKQVQQISKEEKLRQETILWNKWRSDLQNKIMSDAKLPLVPQGTVFKFSFDVDKFGKITNVQTWSTTPTYTPYAIQYIAPVIRSLQGRSILNFPTGSNRVATTVTGAWRIAQTSKYSTSSDFNDSERVSR